MEYYAGKITGEKQVAARSDMEFLYAFSDRRYDERNVISFGIFHKLTAFHIHCERVVCSQIVIVKSSDHVG